MPGADSGGARPVDADADAGPGTRPADAGGGTNFIAFGIAFATILTILL